MEIDNQCYAPVLRLKEGEYNALRELSPSVSSRLLPQLIVPPPDEIDPEFGRKLTSAELVIVQGRRAGSYWPLKPSIIDPRFLFKKLGRSESGDWLPKLFRSVEGAGGRPVPAFFLHDVERESFDGIKDTVTRLTGCMALRLTITDLARSDLVKRVHSALLRLVLKPNDCILIMDFSKADLISPKIVSDYIVDEFQKVMGIGLWAQVIWEGTSFPESNPAAPGSTVVRPRTEWLAWKLAAQSDAEVREKVIFADYSADSAKFNFKKGGARAIAHYRYSSTSDWIIVRGLDTGTHIERMREVAKRVVSLDCFAGPRFSLGDRYINDLALGSGTAGNPSIWRKV